MMEVEIEGAEEAASEPYRCPGCGSYNEWFRFDYPRTTSFACKECGFEKTYNSGSYITLYISGP